MDCALIDVIFKGTQVCWLLKKIMRGLIFGPDFGASRPTGGASSLPSPPYSEGWQNVLNFMLTPGVLQIDTY
jgi:hypothetical protein